MTILESPDGNVLELLPASTDARSAPTSCDALIVDHIHLTDRYWQLALHAPQIARTALPGQFVMITPTRVGETWPVLPRPMAVYSTESATGNLTIVYGVVGPGTRHLRSFAPGEALVTVGPLGRPFSLPDDTRSLLVIGRGIGACSLTMLAERSRSRGLDVTAVASARSPEATVGAEFYRAQAARVVEAYDSDGSSDPARLRKRLEDIYHDGGPEVIAVCGSRRLTRLAAAFGRSWGAEVLVSVEAHMACGLGYCHGCSTGDPDGNHESPLVCRDGPVFRVIDGGPCS